MSVLAAPLSLGTGPGRIEDVEKLVRKVLDDRLRQWGARLKQDDHEEAVSFLITQCWELSGRYDAAKDKKPNFAAYAARILTLRVADWYRQRFGDTRHGGRPVVLSLDAPARAGAHWDEQEGAAQLVDTLAAIGGDPADDCSADLVGLLTGGDRSTARPHDTVGEQAARPAARGARGAAQLQRDTRSAAALAKRGGTGRIPGITSDPVPVCPSCLETFVETFEKVEMAKPEDRRAPVDEIIMRARGRARAVRVKGEWLCPRCAPIENPAAKELLLQAAYPNRRQRRAKKGARHV